MTLNLMIKEKLLNILDKLKKEQLKENEKINLFKDIIYLDENIKEYDNKIKECKLKNRYFHNKKYSE